jgi:[ribosomal protein S18]-alanine N-acetyltransferase
VEDGHDGMTIERVSTEADLDDVAALEAASFPNPWTRDLLAAQVAQPDVARVYILRAGGRAAAFCACWFIHDELHINTIAVEPALRRAGLGTRLLRHVFAEGASAGVRRATLEVRRSNLAALRLYERLGFTVEGVRPRYYTNPEDDALILWREHLETFAAP